jgi:redox-sensitive bicupin YhaK (pirin superfamily)
MSNLAGAPAAAEPCAAAPVATPCLQALPARAADLGGLAIRRLLPARGRRMVGPWCFLDHFGPLAFSSGKPMDVPPHPHIGLQTVSWLLEGEVLHKDSLGLEALARPGALNLMTSGRGIAHSEETPAGASGRLHGLQLWVALPQAERHREPAFDHYPELPTLDLVGGRTTLVMGALAGAASPARAFSPLVAADLELDAGGSPTLPLDREFEHALIVTSGELELDGTALAPGTLYSLGSGRRELNPASGSGARAFLVGGPPFGETLLMWWNFVARTPGEIAAARADWEAGRRFGAVAAYRGERLPAPPLDGRFASRR